MRHASALIVRGLSSICREYLYQLYYLLFNEKDTEIVVSKYDLHTSSPQGSIVLDALNKSLHDCDAVLLRLAVRVGLVLGAKRRRLCKMDGAYFCRQRQRKVYLP